MCSPHTARRWPPTASSRQRSTPCAARRRRNILTGSWCRRKPLSSTRLGQKDEARQDYRKALELKPNEPSVLSNLGMSYVLEGDLRTAETYMRSAAQQPGADSRVRQNLALVVGLQGRFDEAEKIASQELSPEQAQANVAYLRQMLAQQNAVEPAQGSGQVEEAGDQLTRRFRR